MTEKDSIKKLEEKNNNFKISSDSIGKDDEDRPLTKEG